MIYTKRQIKTQDDRYGGYANELKIGRADSLSEIGAEPVKKPAEGRDMLNDLRFGVMTDNISYAPDKTATEAVKPAQKKDDLYTTRETLGKAKAEKQDTKNLDHADVMPTLQTLKYADEQALESAVPQKTRRAAVDGRTKILLAVYITIAIALAAAVIATGVCISTANAESAALVGSIAQKQETIMVQQNEIAELTNEATIRDAAVNNGMVYAEGGTTANRVDKVEYPEATEITNPFDKFCDWFSKI